MLSRIQRCGSFVLATMIVLLVSAIVFGEDLGKKKLAAWQDVLSNSGIDDSLLRFSGQLDVRHGVNESTEGSIKRVNLDWHIRQDTIGDGWVSKFDGIFNDQILILQQMERGNASEAIKAFGSFDRKSDSFKHLVGPITAALPIYGLFGDDKNANLPSLLLASGRLSERLEAEVIVVNADTQFGEWSIYFPRNDSIFPKQIKVLIRKGDVFNGALVGKSGSLLEGLEWQSIEWLDIQTGGTQMLSLSEFPAKWHFIMKSRSKTGGEFSAQYAYQVNEFHKRAGLLRRDFSPSLSVKDGQSVNVGDLPVECVWRNGRIEPKYPPSVGESTKGIRFLGSSLGASFLILGGCVLMFALILIWKLRS